MEEFYFTKSNTTPWVLFTLFFKLYKWHEIPQNVIYGVD